jgi:site-specific DNA recombinase
MAYAPSLPQPAQRAAIYVRVSSPGQEQDGTSLETQEAACRLFAAQHGYIVDEVDIVREVHTGTELWERAELQRLRERVRRRDISVVIAHAIDRLSRDPVHLGVLISEAEHAGAEVLFVTEPLDNSAEGQLIRFVRGYAAKVEHTKIVERTLRGRRARLAAGKPLPGPRPVYGYRWRDEAKSGYEIDPDTAPVVRRMFADAAAGKPLRKIAAEFTADGVPRPNPTATVAWRQSAIGAMLKREIYVGHAVGWRHAVVKDRQRGIRSQRARPSAEQVSLPSDVAPPIIDPSVFEAVQVRLQLNRERSARNNRAPEETFLRGGYVRCGYCDGTMVTHQAGSGGKYPLYECHRRKSSAALCPGASIPTTGLDRDVWKRVETFLTKPDVIADELVRLRREDRSEADLQSVDQRLVRVNRQQRNLVDQLADLGGSVAAIVGEKLSALDAEHRQLHAERESILGRRQAWEAAQARLGDIEAWCRNVASRLGTLTYEQKRLALDALDIRVLVWRPGHRPRYEILGRIPLGAGSSRDCVHNNEQFKERTNGVVADGSAAELPVG